MKEIQDPQSMAELEMIWDVSDKPIERELPQRPVSGWIFLMPIVVGSILLCVALLCRKI